MTKPITDEQAKEIKSIVLRLGWGSSRPRLDRMDKQKADSYIKQIERLNRKAQNQAFKEVLELKLMKDEEMPIHSGIYGDSNIKPDVRNKLRQQLRASIKELMEVK